MQRHRVYYCSSELSGIDRGSRSPPSVPVSLWLRAFPHFVQQAHGLDHAIDGAQAIVVVLGVFGYPNGGNMAVLHTSGAQPAMLCTYAARPEGEIGYQAAAPCSGVERVYSVLARVVENVGGRRAEERPELPVPVGADTQLSRGAGASVVDGLVTDL